MEIDPQVIEFGRMALAVGAVGLLLLLTMSFLTYGIPEIEE